MNSGFYIYRICRHIAFENRHIVARFNIPNAFLLFFIACFKTMTTVALNMHIYYAWMSLIKL